MKRREFLECAALLIGGVSASQLGFSLTAEQKTYLASAPSFIDRNVDYLSSAQRNIIAAMTEVIIPRTDTPGAIDAGVPRFVELMAAEWFNAEERAIFEAGLKDLETRIPAQYGDSFEQLSVDKQIDIMNALESAASDTSWYQLGNVQRDFISDAPFICQMKELTAWGFFSSEIGSTQVLRYDPMPMKFDGDIPLSADESSWVSRF